MPTVEAKCPECGFRVEVSESEQRLIDPASSASVKSRRSQLVPIFGPHARKRAPK
jgi:hypothetical protein